MKRTPFRRAVRAAPIVDSEARATARHNRLAAQGLSACRASTTVGTASGVAMVKRVAVRSKKLLAAVRSLPCQITGTVGRTEPAHSNWPQHGKSGAKKADDNRVAAIRADLHRELDQGSKWSAEERQALWWKAHQLTVKELLARGLWPKGVPVPQTADFWKT